MDWKLVSAFATGAVLASGIVYFFVKPMDLPGPEASRPDVPKQVVTPPKPAPAPPPSRREIAAVPSVPVTEPPAPAPVKNAPARVHLPIREKPSPMPPPVRHPRQEPVIARNLPPASPAPVEPAPTPASPTPAPPTAPPASSAPPPAEKVPVQNVSLPPPAEVRVPPTVTISAGTVLPVRIGETLSSARNQAGEVFLATLTQPLVLNGWVIAERGARVEGRIVDATQGGRLRGTPHLEVSIVRVTLSDGQTIRIRTEPYVRDGNSAAGIFGDLVGHKPAEIPVETRVAFHVLDSVTITERVN
jgi:hypothetical protein